MRQLCSLDGEIQAQQFSAYLFTLGIAAAVDAEQSTDDPASTKWVIWILEEDELAKAREQLALFLENPDDPRYAEAVRQANRLHKEEAEQREQVRKQQVDMQGKWRNQSSSGRRPLTMTLLLICIVVFLFSGYGEDRQGTAMRALQFIDHPAAQERANSRRREAIQSGNQGLVIQETQELENINKGMPTDRYHDLRQGQVWRLVTPIFIHLGFMHLAFNMLWLFQLGTILESRYRSVNFGWLILFTGIAGVLAQSCMPYQWDGSVLGGGFSGVVFGLLGFAWVKTRYDPNSGLVFRNDVFVFMMIFLILGFSGILESFFAIRVANWAHAGGLIAGVLAGFLSIRRP
jgi:GlpG protein